MEPANYWLILLAAYGAVIGSFLNVVIYRLPRGLSVASPRWSFCPACRRSIRFYDNIPVISWLLLRARCRNCGSTIAITYPIIECLTVLLFLAVWDAMATARLVPGVTSVAADWPLIAAYLILFAILLAGAAMDIESYIIDIRICLTATIVGFVGHGLWWALAAAPCGVPASRAPTVIPPALSLVAGAMGATWLITHVIASRWWGESSDEEDSSPPDSKSASEVAAESVQPPTTDHPTGNAGIAESVASTAEEPGEPENASGAPTRFWPVVALTVLTLALLAWQCFAPDQGLPGRLPPGGQRGLAACFLFMLVLVLASMVSRRADVQIVQEIEAERSSARRVALSELLIFTPAVLVGVGLLIALRGSPLTCWDWPQAIARWLGDARWVAFVAGAFHALAAATLAAAIGWAVRILGTLAFGKEAFGTGDIYIMGAIGAVGGLPLLVFAFFLAAILALIGVLVTAFHKSSRAIPFGPWLALGSFVALLLQPTLLPVFTPVASILWSALSGSPTRLH